MTDFYAKGYRDGRKHYAADRRVHGVIDPSIIIRLMDDAEWTNYRAGHQAGLRSLTAAELDNILGREE